MAAPARPGQLPAPPDPSFSRLPLPLRRLHLAFLVPLLAAGALACGRTSAPPDGKQVAQTADSAVAAPPVVRGPMVVAFWLAESDTLGEGNGADLLDDFRAYTQLVAPLLAERGIALTVTTSDSVIVELENGPRRVIMLRGLDYPFGYVLVEPGYAETILTGVSTEDELLDEVDWYFGLDDDTDNRPHGRQSQRV
jgi:hypothetical protein